ncbi:MAG TPA: stage III sporulation protein AF [Clostridiaceae bacterium]|nr:stage III sporulation protein AF [Clostridiaceae bacterium]
MIKFINSWAQGIILAVIIVTIIEIILPEGKNKKYVKTVIGVYILFTIIYPLINKFTKTNINTLIENTTKQMSTYQENNSLKIDTDKYIESTYKKKIEEDIRKRANEKNLNITLLNVYIETEDENRYGMLNSLVMKVEKKETSKKNNDVNQIKEINISKNVQNNEIIENKDKTVTEKEVNEFKEYINATYYLEKEKIHINE